MRTHDIRGTDWRLRMPFGRRRGGSPVLVGAASAACLFILLALDNAHESIEQGRESTAALVAEHPADRPMIELCSAVDPSAVPGVVDPEPPAERPAIAGQAWLTD